VRRVHVDDHQPLPILREDVDAGQLRDRLTERLAVVCRQRRAAPRRVGGSVLGCDRRNHRKVVRHRLRDAECGWTGARDGGRRCRTSGRQLRQRRHTRVGRTR